MAETQSRPRLVRFGAFEADVQTGVGLRVCRTKNSLPTLQGYRRRVTHGTQEIHALEMEWP
jgi:hypothetical protein